MSTCWVPGPSTESSAVSSGDLFSDRLPQRQHSLPRNRASPSCSSSASRGFQGGPSRGAFVPYLGCSGCWLVLSKRTCHLQLFHTHGTTTFFSFCRMSLENPFPRYLQGVWGLEQNMMTSPGLSATLHWHIMFEIMILDMCLCAHLPIYYSSFSLQEKGTRVYKVEALVMTLDCEFLIPAGQVS